MWTQELRNWRLQGSNFTGKILRKLEAYGRIAAEAGHLILT